jgi:hypothetical protein
MLFLTHCFKYCNVPIPEGQFTFYCNNEGLLKKLQYMQSYNNAINPTVLHLEWDMVSAVYCLQSSFHPLPDLQHIKGHQDDGTSVKFLDVPSQLNVVANRLATYDLQEYAPKNGKFFQFKYATRHSLLKESRNWITWLIENMAHQSFAIWDSRNKSRHGHDYSTSIQAETAQVHRDISVLYELRDSVLPEDQDLFCNSIDAHLLRPLSVLKGWLAINCTFILCSVRTARIQAKTGTRPISQYFTARARRPYIPRQKKTPSTPPPRPSVLT